MALSSRKSVKGESETEIIKELNFKIVKSKELVNRYQDFFEDLQSSYSLPEGLVDEIERLQEKYTELFSGNQSFKHNFYPDEVEDNDEVLHTGESYDEPLPVKDDELEISHIKHKSKIPVLDLSKVVILSSSEEGEEESEQEPEKAPGNSVSSDGDPEEFIHILNDDSDPEYRLGSEEANDLDQDYNNYSEGHEIEYSIKPAAIHEFDEHKVHVEEILTKSIDLSKDNDECNSL